MVKRQRQHSSKRGDAKGSWLWVQRLAGAGAGWWGWWEVVGGGRRGGWDVGWEVGVVFLGGEGRALENA